MRRSHLDAGTLGCARGCPAVEGHCADGHETHEDELRERPDAEQGETVAQQRKEEGAEDRVENGPPPTVEAGAADDDGSEHRECEARPRRWCGRPDEGEIEEAGERGQPACDRENPELVAPDGQFYDL